MTWRSRLFPSGKSVDEMMILVIGCQDVGVGGCNDI